MALFLFSIVSFQAIDYTFCGSKYWTQLCNRSLFLLVTRLGKIIGMKESIHVQLMIQANSDIDIVYERHKCWSLPSDWNANQISALLP